MTPDWIFVFPGKTKLEVVTGNSFVYGDRPRILCGRAPEVTEVRGRFGDVTNAIILQSRGRSEVIGFTEALQRAQILRHRAQRVMLKPVGNGEDAVLV